MIKNSTPMEPRSQGFVAYPGDLSVRAGCPYLRVVFILLLVMLASCSSTKKLKQSHSEKESTIDKTEISKNSISNIVTTEKIDTVIHIDADTTGISYYVPWLGDQDTTTSYQEAETPTEKIKISIKPVMRGGKRVSSLVTATSIKKADSITVKVEKKTVSNIQEQTQQKNNISTAKEIKDSSKQVAKKGFRFTGVLVVIGILILLLLALYYYLKKKKIIP